MKELKRRLVYAGGAAIVLSILIIAVASQSIAHSSQTNLCKPQGPTGDCLPYTGSINVRVYESGRLVQNQTIPDLITAYGEQVISRQVSCGATNAPTCANGAIYIGFTTLASPVPNSADTTCFNGNEYAPAPANGLNRALGSYTFVAPNGNEISNNFTLSTSTTVTITGLCLFDASTGGSPFAEDALPTSSTVTTSSTQTGIVQVAWSFTH